MIKIKEADTDIDFLVVGDSNVDLICNVNESYIEHHPTLKKGVFVVCDDQQAAKFLNEHNFHIVPGGTGANVAQAFTICGGEAHFVATIGDDEEGKCFQAEYDSAGVSYDLTFSNKGTNKIFIFITPDGERTGAAYYGASKDLKVQNLGLDALGPFKLNYLDGYYLNQTAGLQNLKMLVEIGKASNALNVFCINSEFVFKHHQAQAMELMHACDILFFSEEEASLVCGGKDLQSIFPRIFGEEKLIIVTRGEKGSVVLHKGTVTKGDIVKPDRPIQNLNGAGDNFVGGFLYGLSQSKPYEECLHLGASCATMSIMSEIPRIRKNTF